ncbi:MAG: hypothetical protein WC870_00070 [Candidatus Paceibacterota bacterium]
MNWRERETSRYLATEKRKKEERAEKLREIENEKFKKELAYVDSLISPQKYKRLTKEEKRLKKLEDETEKQKKALVSQLRKTPIVQFACERTGIGRSTYYDWRKHDLIFARAADRAIEAGRFFINDLAESKLIRLIQEDNLTSIIFWLKHNHPKYASVNRIIHEYETVTNRPSVEENNVSTLELAKLMASKMMPELKTEEIQEKIEEELKEAERNAESDKRLQSFEEE